MRLVIEHSGSGTGFEIHHSVSYVTVNGDGYANTGLIGWAPLGSRVDKWLRPGEENEIKVYGGGSFNAPIRGIRLEAYPAVKAEAFYTHAEQ